MTNHEKEIAERKRVESARKKAQEKRRTADFAEMTETELAEFLHEQLEEDQLRRLLKRIIQLYHKSAVMLIGDESADELADILQAEYQMTNVEAYQLIHELRTRFAPPPQPDPEPEVPEPELDLSKVPRPDNLTDAQREQLDALDRHLAGAEDC
jgi:hypothetical protein